LRPGDFVYLNGEHKAQITGVKKYPSFRDAINNNNYKLLVPHAKSVEEAVRVYDKLFPTWKQKELGVYIFQIEYPVHD